MVQARSAASPGPAVIYFHGNYDLIDTRWSAVQPYVDLGLSALAFAATRTSRRQP